MNELIEKEILDIHALFQAWYRGEMPKEDLHAVIGGRLAENFYIVFPDAKKQSKAELLGMMADDYGNDTSFRIEIHDVAIQSLSDDLYLANYEEWQFWGEDSQPQLKLRSSSVLRRVGESISWIAIHETRIATA